MQAYNVPKAVAMLHLLVILAVAASPSAKGSGEIRQPGNSLKTFGGFEMFSMLDAPGSSLSKYSSDPVQGKIYTSKELTHTNGILTDHDVIEDVGVTKSITSSAPVYKPYVDDALKRPTLDRNTDEQFLSYLPPGSKSISDPAHSLFKTEKDNLLLALERKLKNRKKEGPYESRFYSGTRKRNVKNSLQISYITDAQDAIDRSKQRPSKQVKVPKRQHNSKVDLLYHIQKSVAVNKNPSMRRQPTRSMLPWDKKSRSPLARHFDFRYNSQRKSAPTSAPARPVRNPGYPSERDFFFFKDAFEYGAKLLARKFSSNEEPDTIALNEKLRTAAPESTEDNRPFQSDLEKIKSQVRDNFAKQMRRLATKTTTKQVPTTTELGPTTAEIMPTTAKLRPTTTEKSPTTTEVRPTTTEIGPTTIPVTTTSKTHQKPSTSHTKVKLNTLYEVGRSLLVANETKIGSSKEPLLRNPVSSVHVQHTLRKDLSTRKTTTMSQSKDKSGKTTKTQTPVHQKVKIVRKNQRKSERKTFPQVSTVSEETTRRKSSKATTEATKKPVITTKMRERVTILKNSGLKTSKTRSKSSTSKVAKVKTQKVIVASKISNKLIEASKAKNRNRVTRVYKPEPRVYKIPEWRLPLHFYRRPCPNKVDAIFTGAANKVYVIDGDLVYILNRFGVENGPLPINFVWPHVETPISDGHFRAQDHKTLLFFKNKYVAYVNDRHLVTPPTDVQDLGLPNDFAPFDAVGAWTGNGRTYFFKGNQYWKYSDYYRKLEPGYPRNIQRYWYRVPGNLDAAFIAPNSYLYFIKDGLIYKMNYYKASVQRQYPKKLSESCYDFFM